MAALVAIVVLYLLAMAYALLSARDSLQSGANAVHLVTNLSALSLRASPKTTLARAQIDLSRAHSDFASADDHLFPFSPVLSHLGFLPSVGGEISAAPAAARLADQATGGALGVVQGLQKGLGPPGSATHVAATSLLRGIADQHARFQQACDQLSQADSTRRSLDGINAPSISQRLGTIDRELPKLTSLCQAMVLLPQLLGFGQPERYLVAYENPAQLRATGGFLGSAGLLTMRNGQAHQQFRGTWLHDNLSYPPPEPIARYEGEPAWLFRDSNWSPNFPTTAALERFFAHLDLGWKVQGVIDMTPQATADALTALGPFYSPAYHRWITGKNVARLTDFYSHHSRNYGPLKNLSGDTARKQFIQIVARRIFGSLHSLTPTQMIALAREMGKAVQHRDVLINFNDPAAQALAVSVSADGAISGATSDYLDVVDSNLSYNKVNPYIRERVTYRAQIRADRWIESRLTIRFRNVPAPADVYADSYGPGAGRTGTKADYADFVRVLVPPGAEVISQKGWQTWAPATAYGKTMLSGYLIVRKGTTRTVELRYLVPPNVFSWSQGRRYRLLVQRQPGLDIRRLTVTVTGTGVSRYTSTWSHPQTDRIVTLPVSHRMFHALPLPLQLRTVVAPGRWIEPYTYLVKR